MKDKMKYDLEKHGYYYRQAAPQDEIEVLLESVGSCLMRTEVKPQAGSRSLVNSDRPLPLHTDHGRARFIAWHCHAPAMLGGESIICDAKNLIQSLLPHHQSILGDIKIPEHHVFNGDPGERAILYGEGLGRIYFSPWLIPLELRGIEAVVALIDRIEAARCERFRLEKDDFLIVDNRRVLHGRAEMTNGECRHLTRWWIGD